MTKNNYLKISLLDDSNEKGNIYLTGNFNGWKPADERYQMINASDNYYFIDIPLALIPDETLDYKYTRGDWHSVELNSSGKHTPNRKWAMGMPEPKDIVNLPPPPPPTIRTFTELTPTGTVQVELPTVVNEVVESLAGPSMLPPKVIAFPLLFRLTLPLAATLPIKFWVPVVEIFPEIKVVPLIDRLATFVIELYRERLPANVRLFPPPSILLPLTVTVEPVRVRSPPLRMRLPV